MTRWVSGHPQAPQQDHLRERWGYPGVQRRERYLCPVVPERALKLGEESGKWRKAEGGISITSLAGR